ncbi:hypothetical protein [Thermotalea metallivorans]|uniref:DUF4375 domain-containing protein n=1 Tax=Thermotalea metallivorans TaxID=520762 RepID=A0A140L4Q8_9FIRM|nr:hypothetical protein [Thermotalea metallivorans]KXG75533.1 hypothetical protein AN619_16750 [Thermotalea metallivorans]
MKKLYIFLMIFLAIVFYSTFKNIGYKTKEGAVRNSANDISANKMQIRESYDAESKMEGIEEQIFRLFADIHEKPDNKTLILSIIKDINWSTYESLYSNASFDLLNWLGSISYENERDMISILQAVDGLDGAMAEEYASIVGQIFLKDKNRFIKCLSKIPETKMKTVNKFVAYYCSYKDINQIRIEIQNMQNEDFFNDYEREVIIYDLMEQLENF